jgi:hypothetical protein
LYLIYLFIVITILVNDQLVAFVIVHSIKKVKRSTSEPTFLRRKLLAMSLSPEFLQYLANVGISEENFIASSIGERTLAYNNFRAFQQQQQQQQQQQALGNYLPSVNSIELRPQRIFVVSVYIIIIIIIISIIII